MNTAPKVSIIIPVYNMEKYLYECLDSVVNQTLKDIEIVCINDGSTDSSLAILQEYAANDARLRVINQANAGLSTTRNRGLDLTQGEYIQFVDADDIVDVTLCEKAYNLAIAEGSDVVVFDVKYFKNITENTQSDNKLSNIISQPSNNYDKAWLLKTRMEAWTKLVHKTVYEKNKITFPVGIRNGEDICAQWQVCCLSNSFSVLPECLYFYRINPRSLSHHGTWTISESLAVCAHVKNFLIDHQLWDNYKEIYDRFAYNHCFVSYLRIITTEKHEAINTIKDIVKEADPNVLNTKIVGQNRMQYYWMLSFYKGINGNILYKIMFQLFTFMKRAQICIRLLKK